MKVPPNTQDMDLAAVATGRQLQDLLQLLYVRAGHPSYRTLETRARSAGMVLSKTRAGEIVNGVRLPSRDALTALVHACGVPAEDVEPWVRAWERIAASGGYRPGGVVASTPENERLREHLRAQLRDELRAEAEQIVAEAWAEAAAILANARTEAETILVQARTGADLTLVQARAEADDLVRRAGVGAHPQRVSPAPVRTVRAPMPVPDDDDFDVPEFMRR
ncbi:hypothetical protein ACWEN6_39525 [Sphaerisporangium sp. NPDC004334]